MINDIIQLLGIANPQLSVQWSVNVGSTLVYDNAFTVSSPGENFVTPVSGVLNVNKGLEKIVMPTGGSLANGAILKLDPQVYLKLTRLYADIIEGKTAANNNAVAERPVPCYFVYSNVVNSAWTDGDGNAQSGPIPGLFYAGTDLQLQGDLTIHDEHGFPIDPVAVAGAFNAFITASLAMQSKALNSTTGNATSQIATFSTAHGNGTNIHLLAPNGTPYNPGALPFSNLGTVNAAQGLYSITNTTTAITINGGGPQDLRIGPATNGTLGTSYTITAQVATLQRDFVRAYVVSLNSYLLGNAPNTEPAIQYNTATNNLAPVVRDNEQVTFCLNGNQCLGAINTMLTTGTPALSLLVSPTIDTDFVLPPNTNNVWPQFPAGGGAPPFQPVPANLNITASVAHFITDAATNNADVYLELSSTLFVAGDSVRVYTRVFHDDGTETRGDGAGVLVASNKAAFRLTDPFDLVHPFQPVVIPVNPTLMVDVVVVNRGLFKRTFGNINCTVAAAQASPLAPVNNTLNAVPERGISTGGIQGIITSTPAGGFPNFGNFLLNVLGENQPRVSSRYPTMGRYDSMAAAFAGGNWQAFCGGTIVKKDGLNNFPLLGNPGNPGGKEYSSTGIQTSNGLLAYDIARATYRRTRNVIERMGSFFTGTNAANWQPPTAPAAGPNNSFAAAVLQTVANHCETPEIGLAFNDMSNVPNSLAAFITQVQNAILPGGTLPSWVPSALQTRFQNFITGVGNDPQNQQAYNELYREFVTSLYGRRDTYWALKDAITNARECIYIQGTFFGHTSYPGPTWPSDDFVEILKNAVINNPRLKVILCLSKPIHYGKGYEMFEAWDYQHRKEAIDYLQGDPDSNHIPARASQVLAFHPNGFPMRPKELRHQVVIVDDMWALVGSSSFRRRGMQFDGSEDVVLMDKRISNGKSTGIKNFRISLMQEHLNLQNNTGLTPAMQIRLNDLHETFYTLKELLDSGGAGLITRIWEGDRKDITLPSGFTEDLTDPDNTAFNDGNATLIAALGALSTTTPG